MKNTNVGFNETKNISMFICKDVNNASMAREKFQNQKLLEK